MFKHAKRYRWILALCLLLIGGLALTGCEMEAPPDDGPVTEAPESTMAPTTEPTAEPLPPTPTEEPADEGEVTLAEANVTEVAAAPQNGEVLVTVRGEHPDGCTTVDAVSTSYAAQTFTIDVTSSRPADALCTQQIVPFEETVSLDVVDLAAGSYTVTANGVSETFTLGEDESMEPTLSVSPASGDPGTTVTLTAQGLPAEASVEIGLGRVNSEYDIIDSAETDATGRLDYSLTVPDFAYEPGEWAFVVETADNQTVVSNNFTITGAEAQRSDIYLIAPDDGGANGPEVGCGDSILPVTVEVVPDDEMLLINTLEALLTLGEREYGQSGLYNALHQSTLSVTGVEITDGQAAVYLSGELQVGGVCDGPRVAAQLEYTVEQFEAVDEATFFVDDVPLSELLDLSG